MSGIPWTWVWGILYLSSFLVIAGIGALSRCADTESYNDIVDSSDTTTGILRVGVISRAAAWLHVGVWGWCIYALLHPIWGHVENSPFIIFPLLPSAIVLFLIPAVFIVGILFNGFFDPVHASCCGGAMLVGTTTLLAIGVTQVWVRFLFYLPNKDFIRLLMVMELLLIILWAKNLHPSKMPSSFVLTFFGLTNLLLSVLYYCFLYNPVGTNKPSWAGRLG
jgi:hypothetical protein